MKFSQKSFSVPMGLSKQGRDNWDRTFGKKKEKLCPVCEQKRDTDNPCDDAFHLPSK
jgi:hypothetical protein